MISPAFADCRPARRGARGPPRRSARARYPLRSAPGREHPAGTARPSAPFRHQPASARIVAVMNCALRGHGSRQQAERAAAAGRRRAGTGYASTTVTGTPFRPDRMTRLLAKLVAASGLPPVTRHGLRHGAATLALAAGADLKVVQDQLGHSTITLTADTYTSVLPETRPHRRRAHRRTPVPRPPAFQPETPWRRSRAQETSALGTRGPPQAPPAA